MPPQMAQELPSPAERPTADVVLYDGRCVFCQRQVERLLWWDCQERLAYLSLHDPEAAEHFPDASPERLREEMCIVDQQGRQHWGAEAVRYLSRRLRRLWWLSPLMHLPGIMLLAKPAYRLVARNRYRLMGKTDECADGSCALHR